MRKIIAIALNSLIRMGRDRKALVLLLLMPMILVGILGASLKNVMTMGKISPFTVIVVNDDQPAALHLGKTLVDDVLQSDEVGEVITVALESDREAATQKLTAGIAQADTSSSPAAVVYIPPTFSADVLAGKQASVELITDPGRPTQVEIISQIVRTFTDRVTSESVAMALTGTGAASPSSPPKIVQRQSGVREVGSFQYYAAAMAVMYMLMSALQRTKSMLEDRESGVLNRVLISPTPRWMLLAGQLLATALLIICQFLILLVGTTLLYGVHWGDWLPVLVIGCAFALAAAGIATMLASLFRDAKAADSAVGLLGMLFAALSGSMIPLYGFPEGLINVAKAIPNYWALQGFIDQMAGLGFAYAWQPVTILCIISLVTGSLGTWRMAHQ